MYFVALTPRIFSCIIQTVFYGTLGSCFQVCTTVEPVSPCLIIDAEDWVNVSIDCDKPTGATYRRYLVVVVTCVDGNCTDVEVCRYDSGCISF